MQTRIATSVTFELNSLERFDRYTDKGFQFTVVTLRPDASLHGLLLARGPGIRTSVRPLIEHEEYLMWSQVPPSIQEKIYLGLLGITKDVEVSTHE